MGEPIDQSEQDIQLMDVVRALLHRWPWIIASTILLTASCAIFAFTSVPIYRATAVIVPAGVDRGLGSLGASLGQLGGLASLVGINLASQDAESEEALAVLRSREFVEKFIHDKELLPRFFSQLWDQSKQEWAVPATKQPTLAKGFKYLTRRVLTVAKDKKTGLVNVTVDWRDPAEAADWANELVARMNTEMRGRAVARSSAYIAYLEAERGATQFVETREAINKVMEAQIQQRMIASVSQDYAFRIVDKAMPPDADDIWKPRRVRLIAMGFVAGGLLGCALVLMFAVVRGEFGVSRQPAKGWGSNHGK